MRTNILYFIISVEKNKITTISGSNSCGKTTLIQHLYVEMKIAGLNAGYALEYSTEYLKDKESGILANKKDAFGYFSLNFLI